MGKSLKESYEYVLVNKPYQKPLPKKHLLKQFKSLAEVYQHVQGFDYGQIGKPEEVQQTKVNSEDIETLLGLGAGNEQNAELILGLYNNYNSSPNEFKHFLNTITLTSKMGDVYNYDDLKSIIEKNKSRLKQNKRSFKITQSPKGTVKFRTDTNQRLGKWEKEKNLVNVQRPSINTKRILMIFELYKQFNDVIEIKGIVAAGLAYEAGQTVAIQDAINEIKPDPGVGLRLILPDDTDSGVIFNGATNINGNPKADFALTYNDQEVFWISYKEGPYFKEDGSINPKITFQQYGELRKIYKQSTGSTQVIKDIINNFGEVIANNNPNTTMTSLKKLEYFKDNPETSDVAKYFMSHRIRESGIDKYVIIPQKTSYYYNFYEKDPDSELTILALKGIYGNMYGETDEFGQDNVNILIQTNTDITLDEFVNEETDETGYKLNPGKLGHIIKNPDMPQSEGHIPVLHLRYTYNSYFTIENSLDEKVALLGCRCFIFPVGNIPSSSIEITL